MAIPLRVEFLGAPYHITCRGDPRAAISKHDEDREGFLNVSADEVAQRYNRIGRALCLTTNHHHLMIETVEVNRSQVSKELTD